MPGGGALISKALQIHSLTSDIFNVKISDVGPLIMDIYSNLTILLLANYKYTPFSHTSGTHHHKR